jgi:hypothetical protein
VGQVQRLAVGNQPMALADDAQHALIITVNNGLLIRHRQAPFTVSVGVAYEHWMLVHREKHIIQFIEACHDWVLIVFNIPVH